MPGGGKRDVRQLQPASVRHDSRRRAKGTTEGLMGLGAERVAAQRRLGPRVVRVPRAEHHIDEDELALDRALAQGVELRGRAPAGVHEGARANTIVQRKRARRSAFPFIS